MPVGKKGQFSWNQLISLPQGLTPPDLEDGVWDALFLELGTRLPDDYIDFVNQYGPGEFGGFVVVSTPLAGSRRWRLTSSEQKLANEFPTSFMLMRDINRLKQSISNTDVFEYPLYPSTSGLLPWGGDFNGNIYCWETVGAPNSWPVVVIEDGFDANSQRFECGLYRFFQKTFSGELSCNCWPSDFPGDSLPFCFVPHT